MQKEAMNIKTMSDEICLPMYEGKQQTTATEMVHIFGGSHSMSVRTFAAISDEDKKPKLKYRQIYYTRCAYRRHSFIKPSRGFIWIRCNDYCGITVLVCWFLLN
eukprot:1094806_1